ncbi:hypothetical protein GCM10009628_37140 [Paeniglutamicibacter kerguelensis]
MVHLGSPEHWNGRKAHKGPAAERFSTTLSKVVRKLQDLFGYHPCPKTYQPVPGFAADREPVRNPWQRGW